ncbi:hypothetical protein [Phocaeicola coprocola]|jgi:hypothetical protein|uniref:hypothetical protein n=1 Tax=Phocaeicola coprocola TaxID=310298 RepID=UPI003AEF2F79|nr:hypothetical protein [Bacteroides sp.]
MKNVILLTIMLFVSIASFGQEQTFYFNRVKNINTQESFDYHAVIKLTDERKIVISSLNSEPVTYHIIETKQSKTKLSNKIVNVTQFYCVGNIIIYFIADEKLTVALQDEDMTIYFWYEEEQ